MEDYTATAGGQTTPNQSETYTYIGLSPTYGRPTVQHVENISHTDMQHISKPLANRDQTSIISYQQSERGNKYDNLESLNSDSDTENFETTNETFKKLLKSWKLEHLTEFLISEKINIDILKIIKRRHINMLFKNQKIGDLVVFEQSLTEWRSSLSLFVDEEENESLPERGIQNSQLTYVSSPTDSRATGSPELNEAFSSLSDILNECPKSKNVTNYYERNSKLLEEHRTMLIGIICNYFQDNNYHMSLSASHRLEKEILNRFPGEKLEYYRVGRRGKIYIKACNAKSSARSFLKRTLIPDVDTSENLVIGPINTLNMEFSPEADAEELVRRLKYDNLSTAEFESCWQACSQYRMKNMLEASSLASIFAKWPEYKNPSTGYRFIDKDFKVLFGSRPGILGRWPEQASALKKFLLRENHLKDKLMIGMLEKIDQADITTETAAVKLLWCLHAFLVPTQKTVKKDNTGKKSVVKFSVHSSQQAFLFIASSVQEIDEHLRFLATKGENIQPFLIGLGDINLENISNFYVYLDGVKFIFNSFLRAVDICYKVFHLFHLEYPLACSQIWAFIENHFYDMKSTKNTSPKMFVLSEELNSPST